MKKCAICNKEKKKTYVLQKNGYRVVRCLSCNGVYIDPLPSQKQLDAYYKREFAYVGGFGQEALIRREAESVLSRLGEIQNKKAVLLDVGCGAGFFLDEAQKAGFSVFGVEMSKKLVAYAKKKLGLKNIQNTDFQSAQFGRQKFDVIILSQVIEHLIEPNEFIQRVYRLLKPSGIFYIATPNITSYSSMILGADFPYMTPPEHTFFYSPQTVSRILRKHEFLIEKLQTYGYPQDLAGIIKHTLKRKSAKKEIGKVQKKTATTNSDLSYPKNPIKLVKYILFDKIFCNAFFKLLNIGDHGSIIEVFARKR